MEQVNLTEIRRHNLQKWIDEHCNGKQSKFIELTDINQGELSSLLKNRAFGEKKARGIEKKAGMPTMWLDTQHTDKPSLRGSNNPLPEDDYMFVPFLKESECTSGGSFRVAEYNGFWLPFGKSTLYLKNIQPENVFCCTLNGNSMKPRIADDATIAVDRGAAQTIKDGKIYAFQHDDLFRVKYLYRVPSGKVRIHSENNEYPDEVVNSEEIRIIGRVFWWSVFD